MLKQSWRFSISHSPSLSLCVVRLTTGLSKIIFYHHIFALLTLSFFSARIGNKSYLKNCFRCATQGRSDLNVDLKASNHPVGHHTEEELPGRPENQILRLRDLAMKGWKMARKKRENSKSSRKELI